ncbi:hypothetical protein IGS68_31730 (plasmid) [Skermanella sp. TT6]|uniref:Uncharacterized protein n=1 Tax=Skermanella cutis TaxID=2775420 RepID=A0ABX7BGR8_9PROT|nr:hypothetical protein [Skermanella sp. TT6]QQP93596.1 hypothetical protein IGS68_31730 [Skermanella sp. TT6]
MDNTRQTGQKQESLWTLAAALILMGGIFAVATALDRSGAGTAGQSRGTVVHDQSFAAALSRFPEEMSRNRPELFGSFADGDVRIRSCLGFLTATARPDRLRHFGGLADSHHYDDCLPLRAAYLGRSPRNFLGPDQRLGQILGDRLDPSRLKDLLPAWIRPARRLRDAGADRIEILPHGIVLHRDGRAATVEVLASADITGRGIEDLVIRVTGSGPVRHALLEQDRSGALVPMDRQAVIAHAGLGNQTD